MPATYEPIATQTVTGVGTVSFTSIPSTYTDLKVIYSGYNDAPIYKMNLNGDTGNLSTTFAGGNGNATGSARYSDGWLYVWAPGVGTIFNMSIDIMNYSNANKYKSWLCRTNITDGSGGATVFVGAWRSNTAVNRVDIMTSSATMSGTFTIYGIKAA
jgi:hypothetical protein